MKQIQVTIMGQPYILACQEGEEATLQNAVSFLDRKMRAIRDTGKVKGTDRIAVMAALGISADLLAYKQPTGPFTGMTVSELQQKLDEMQKTLDKALIPQENLF